MKICSKPEHFSRTVILWSQFVFDKTHRKMNQEGNPQRWAQFCMEHTVQYHFLSVFLYSTTTNQTLAQRARVPCYISVDIKQISAGCGYSPCGIHLGEVMDDKDILQNKLTIMFPPLKMSRHSYFYFNTNTLFMNANNKNHFLYSSHLE